MNEQNIFIVRCGEVALKGMNKPYFERMLADRIRRNLKNIEGVSVETQGWADLYQVRKKYRPRYDHKGDDKGFWSRFCQ